MLKCKVCDSQSAEFSFRAKGIDFFKCNNCQFVFIPFYERAVINYEDYKDQETYNQVLKSDLWLKVQRNKLRLGYLKKYLPKNGTILDIGSGWGHFVYTANLLGYNACGIEMAKLPYKFSQEQLNIRAYKGDFFNININEKYDMITMWDVLEHIDDCDIAIDKCFGLLKPGGHLVFHVPRLDSYIAKKTGINWQAMGRDHVNYFTPKTAKMLLERKEFKVVSITSSIELKLFLMYWFYEKKDKRKTIIHSDRQQYFNKMTNKPKIILWLFTKIHNVTYRILRYLRIGDEMTVIAKKRN